MRVRSARTVGTIRCMDTEEIRQTLQGEEVRLTAMRDDIRAGDELDSDQQTQSGGELSVVDQHPADIASEQVQREVSLSMLEQVEAELSDVEAAMRKLDEGTYGKCEACGKDIAEERLAALPMARFCLEDQAGVEREAGFGQTLEGPGTNNGASPI